MGLDRETSIFKFGGMDYTHNVLVPMTVNYKDIYEEFTDGNTKFCRQVLRKRIQGTINMLFQSSDEYDDFIRRLEYIKNAEGAILATVYVRNLRQAVQSYFYVDYDPPLVDPLLGIKNVEPLQLKIEEQ